MNPDSFSWRVKTCLGMRLGTKVPPLSFSFPLEIRSEKCLISIILLYKVISEGLNFKIFPGLTLQTPYKHVVYTQSTSCPSLVPRN